MKPRHFVAAATWLALAVVTTVGVARALPAGTPATGELSVRTATLGALDSGDSTTDFVLVIPESEPNKFCKGDGIAGYRFSSFFIPAAEDAATLRFTPSGLPSLPSGTAIAPLITANGGPVTPQNPGLENGLVNGSGIVLDLDNAFFGTIEVPGEYELGYACYDTDDAANPAPYQIDDYWTATFAVTANSGDGANDFDWTVQASTPGTTTTTQPDEGSTTTTTVADGSSTTTTVADGTSTTTTVDGGSTTTTVASNVTATTTQTGSGGVVYNNNTGGGGSLAVTGSATVIGVVVALLVLIIGRMTILSARRVKVLPPDRP